MRRARALVIVLVLGLPGVCRAHDPGLSALEVRVARTQIVADLVLAASDADAASRGGFETAVAATMDGRPLPPVRCTRSDDGSSIRVRFVWQRPAGDRLAIVSEVPRLLASGHRQLVSIRTTEGALLAERMLDAAGGDVTATMSDGGAAFAAASFVRLGIEHIATGLDHLLFVAALLLGVRRPWDAVKTVTAFTAAHSITLAASTLRWVQLSGGVVEPLIAASIMYVAAENVVRGVAGSRAPLTFAFGLIHGFGFAGALRELGVGASGGAIAVPLAAFNLGVEAGQVAVVVMLMPILSRLRAYPVVAARWATAGSALVFTAGAYWLVERL